MFDVYCSGGLAGCRGIVDVLYQQDEGWEEAVEVLLLCYHLFQVRVFHDPRLFTLMALLTA